MATAKQLLIQSSAAQPTDPAAGTASATTAGPVSGVINGKTATLLAGMPSPLKLAPSIQAGIAISAKHTQLGGDTGFTGKSISPVQAAADGQGFFELYQGASIYWSPSSGGAHEIHGAIRDKWQSLGAKRSFLGYPITDETGTPDGVGRFNHFQGGSIYWTPATGAHEVHGAIRDKWSSLGWEISFLGYPITDETGTPDGVGRFNHFQGGSIYWTPATGAHEIHGAIHDKWASMGWERSFLGYPVTDETGVTVPNIGAARISNFERGSILWTANLGAVAHPQQISFQSGVTTSLPLGGSVDVVLTSQGDITVVGYLHNSGFDNIDYTLSIVIVSSSGAAIGVQHSGHTEGTVAGLPFGTPNRDDTFTINQNNQQLIEKWQEFAEAKMVVQVDAQDTLAEGAAKILGDLAQDALVTLGSDAAIYFLALIFA